MSVEDICVNDLRNSLLSKIGSAWEIENEETIDEKQLKKQLLFLITILSIWTKKTLKPLQ
jgi:hypothetical protein